MWNLILAALLIVVTHLYTKEQIKQECYQRGWVVFGVNEQAVCFKSEAVLNKQEVKK